MSLTLLAVPPTLNVDSAAVHLRLQAVEKSGQLTETIHHFIPEAVWTQHEVFSMLGWHTNRVRLEAQTNTMTLPTTILGAVLSGLALAPERMTPDYNAFVWGAMNTIAANYRSLGWNATQRKNREDRDWLADQVQQFQQECRMGLDRSFARHLCQRSLHPHDPLEPIVALSRALFAPTMVEASRCFSLYQQDLERHQRALDLAEEMIATNPGVSRTDLGELRRAAYQLQLRAWGDENPGTLMLGLDPERNGPPYGDIVARMTLWLRLAQEHPLALALATLAIASGQEESSGRLWLRAPDVVGLLRDHIRENEALMAGRAYPTRVSWHFTGFPAAHDGNDLARLYRRDTSSGRKDGPLAHCAAHLVLDEDGYFRHSDRYSRPWHLDPQIAARGNDRAIGVYVCGQNRLTSAQTHSLQSLVEELTHYNSDRDYPYPVSLASG